MHYVLNGHEVVPEPDFTAWARWIEANKGVPRRDDPEGMDPCRVGSDDVGEWWVSTVFMGLDYSWVPGGRPIVFETMVFPKGSYDEAYMQRYATWDEAEAGHRRVVEGLKAGKMPEKLYSDDS